MKFYKNRAARYHPALQISESDKTWKNMVMTHKPNNKQRFIKLKKNPNRSDPGDAYIEKYVRTNPIRTRGDILKRFNLSDEDLAQIEKYLEGKRKS